MQAPRRSTRPPAPRFRSYDYGPCPSEHLVQDKFFYTADSPTFAIKNATHPEDSDFTATPKSTTYIRFDTRKWQNEPRPRNYFGSWPPTSAAQLMSMHFTLNDLGDPQAAIRFQREHGDQVKSECLGKYCWQTVAFSNGVYCAEENCNHTFTEWLTGAENWQERFEIRRSLSMGYGLYSMCKWKKGDILGAYLGELIPSRTGCTEYCHEVSIGPEFEKTKAAIAYIDAEMCGNYVRFCNHSCESNAEICTVRVGMERCLALIATKSIRPGDEICIDYGSDYFRHGQFLCGSSKCKYSNVVNVASPMELSSSTWGSRTTRYDSVLYSAQELEMEL